jgi:hypothetical protein
MIKCVLRSIGMNRITVNGVTIVSSGNVCVVNGRIVVGGKDVTPDAKEITIVVEGPVERLQVDACKGVSVTGNVGSISTASGDVEVTGNVNGGVSTASGDVTVSGGVGGFVKTVSGDVDCGNVAEGVSTNSGDISHRG